MLRSCDLNICREECNTIPDTSWYCQLQTLFIYLSIIIFFLCGCVGVCVCVCVGGGGGGGVFTSQQLYGDFVCIALNLMLITCISNVSNV